MCAGIYLQLTFQIFDTGSNIPQSDPVFIRTDPRKIKSFTIILYSNIDICRIPDQLYSRFLCLCVLHYIIDQLKHNSVNAYLGLLFQPFLQVISYKIYLQSFFA
jgi:hypothetical protein